VPFNSFVFFLAFLPIVVFLTVGVRMWLGATAAQFTVLVASLTFYGWYKPSNLWYLGVSIVLNFILAQTIARLKQPFRRRMLVTGLILNVGYLCVFKYVNFLLGNLSFLGHGGFRLPEVNFPLGISFFTLSQIMYLVDCYEELIPPMSLFDHATFVALFSYVVSGPIAKAGRMKNQFSNLGGVPESRSALISRGLFLFTLGLFKKVVFADAFAAVSNLGFDKGIRVSAAEAWIFSTCYMFQLYFDFSGYSDMAVGTGIMLGLEIPRNFDAPLRAKSIIEFWQRWHITLTNFITTYLYTPILRSFPRLTLFTSSLATLVAMTIVGLWHGPSWTFVIYGVLHGLALSLNQYWRKKKLPKLPGIISWLITLACVDIALIYFRSQTMHGATQMVLSLANFHHPFGTAFLFSSPGIYTGRLLIGLTTGSVLAFFGKSSTQLASEFEPKYWNSFAIASMIVVCFLSLVFNTTQSFIYFKF
jgi:D-alanyl-lipoteichoic acid acyltransferase DltB (MBOAT superfamily)